ncbi:D-alanyl-D-alanine dipeptidase [Flavobacterium sandaracinum]|uniref:D-alanyl-D-alanine dipeptidase n=1 Tax=Flavobacterium sandaracinum TaxID=2541733 RepID=A0A4R5CRB6_9FLAO|nr:D-alanyl-D-alanine dipeptidase [Flavobacterium sandaracinum]TDE02766.1 D-alanyl-D-alanine dipeptidase [Flavobacterium sandaracinum]
MLSYFKLLVPFCIFFCFASCKSQAILSDKLEINSSLSNDTTFVNLKEYTSDFVYDMKYATEDNFLKTKVYDCAECFLRLKTVKALIEANKKFIEKGYKIKIFDCYRPLDIQKKMWTIVSNPKYVANPAKGSIHNRGGAVDITLVDDSGTELDMGTTFDFFGIEASHNYPKVSEAVKQNRILLKTLMTSSGFNSFDSEWWHYNLKSGLNDKVSNAKWDCK